MLAESDTGSLKEFLRRGPYVGYTYSYPHKTAYRSLSPRPLGEVWQQEKRDALFLYVHVPFCEFRCGFCNLFTISQPDQDVPKQYLDSFQRQARIVKESLAGDFQFAEMAIGGGTPSYLNIDELEQLFETLVTEMNVDGSKMPVGFEVSPATVDSAKLRLLKDFGVDRISMGVQSFDGKDVGAMGRPQKRKQVLEAIEAIRRENFKTLNLDLIYGATGQTLASWLQSVDETVSLKPEEIFLYPLYVQQLTGLSNRKNSQQPNIDDSRMALYRAGRDRLLESGYEQVSMRMFRLAGHEISSGATEQEHQPDYLCQRDGMIGLGCGARSYTSNLHYGSRFAVRQSAVTRIVSDYVKQTDRQFSEVAFGIEIDESERRRRYLILSLFLNEGLCMTDYQRQFGSAVVEDFPQLQELIAANMATVSDERFCLNDEGISWSDALGPWLYSQNVQRRMEDYAWHEA